MQIETHSEKKRCFIVVGKMGHGKSSFVRCMALPKGANPFISSALIPTISSGLTSATLHPDMYLVDPSHNLTSDNQPLYVIDTQGLDSETSVSLVVEEIDDLIKQHGLNIIGIAFVINPSGGRIIGADNTSLVRKFLDVLKIKRAYIEDLLFFVATNWRSSIENGQVEEKMEGIRDAARSSGLNNKIFAKTVYWESGPGTIKGYQKYTNSYLPGEGKDQIERQWNTLRQNLTNQIPKMYTCQQYITDCQHFWQKLAARLSNCYKQKQKHTFQQDNFKLEFQTSEIQKEDIKKNLKQQMKTGIQLTASTMKSLNQQSDNKLKIGQMAKKTQYITNLANSFSQYLPQSVKKYIEDAHEVNKQIINVINEETNNGLGEGISLYMGWSDVPAAMASIGLLIFSTRQYYEEKKVKVLNPVALTDPEQIKEAKLRQKLKLMQKSMLEASLYSKVFYKNYQLFLRQDIESVIQIKVLTSDEQETLLGSLSSKNPLSLNSKNETLSVKLQVTAWLLTFESFDRFYRKQIADYYSV